jgi:hypothetical protein
MNQETKTMNAPAGASSNDLAAQHLAQLTNYKGVAKAGWICLAIGFVFAFIPVVGWFVVGPMMLVGIILGIVVMTRGGTGHGIVLILCALLVLPIIAMRFRVWRCLAFFSAQGINGR